MTSSKEMMSMSRRRPHGFSDIVEVMSKPIGTFHSIMGVVIDVLPIADTRGSDPQMTFTINDGGPYLDGIKVKFFAKREFMPETLQIGDVIILHSVKTFIFSNQRLLLRSNTTDYIILSGERIVKSDFRISHASTETVMTHTKSLYSAKDPTIWQQQWAITLKEIVPVEPVPRFLPTMVPSTHSIPARPGRPQLDKSMSIPANGSLAKGTTNIRDKFSLMKDARVDKFYDLSGEVLKKFPNMQGYIELYITDYTTNEGLRHYESDANTFDPTAFPPGKITLKIEIMPPQALWVMNNINEGDKILLLNVRIKYNREKEVEGNIWPDRLYPDRPNVIKLQPEDPILQKLCARREESRAARRSGADPNMIGIKKKDKSMSKTERRRRAKQAKESLSRALPEGSPSELMQTGSDGDINMIDEANDPSITLNQTSLNPAIKVTTSKTVLSTLSDLIANPHRRMDLSNGTTLDLPFVNWLYRVHIRVVDYFPHELRNFAVLTPASADSKLLHNDTQEWKWNFCLVVAPADTSDSQSTHIQLEVVGAEATKLLGLKAAGLQRDTPLTKRLRERLFHLWGDLEERKQEFFHSHRGIPADASFSATKHEIFARNLPFEALVKEAGLPIRRDEGERWARVWRLFDTRIE